jgi:hypothetical protein
VFIWVFTLFLTTIVSLSNVGGVLCFGDSNHHSVDIHFQPICDNQSECSAPHGHDHDQECHAECEDCSDIDLKISSITNYRPDRNLKTSEEINTIENIIFSSDLQGNSSCNHVSRKDYSSIPIKSNSSNLLSSSVLLC